VECSFVMTFVRLIIVRGSGGVYGVVRTTPVGTQILLSRCKYFCSKPLGFGITIRFLHLMGSLIE